MVSLHKFYPITGCLLIAALTSVVCAGSALSLVPEIDAIGEYSEVTEFPVTAGEPLALSALADHASRRVTGRIERYAFEAWQHGVLSASLFDFPPLPRNET